MKRHPSLQSLSEDHHYGLVQARHLLAADLARALERGNALDIDRIRSLGERFDEHIRLEERVIFPLIEEAVPEEELVELAASLRARG